MVYKPLYSIVSSISTGLNPRQNFVLNETGASFYYVTVKEITTNKVVFSTSTDMITEKAKQIINNRSKLSKGDILFSGIGTIGKVAYVDIPTDNWDCSESVFLIKPNEKEINGKFLAYILASDTAKSQYERGAAGAIMKGVRKATLENLLIPLPSFSEQNRIVGILDSFTTSLDNLKGQITQRRKQYDYYRNQLLDLEGKRGVEMKTIQDVCIKICSGGTPSTSHKEYYDGIIPWLRTQEVDWNNIYDTEIKITKEAIENSSAKLIPQNCVIVAMYGATAAKVAINKIPLCTNQACCNLMVNNNLALYKYVYYWLCREYLNLKSMGEGSQNNINGQKVKTYPIPLVSLEEQVHIVSILDTFEASIANLEAQLKEREKQYEYYRNKLLTFD